MNNEYTIKRHLEKQIIECTKEAKVPCVIGPRQVGKTTLLKAVLPKINNYSFVRLDDLVTRSEAINDPIGFLSRHQNPLCIDEVQKAPQLFEAIKDAVDESPEKGQYILTGSESIGIIRGIGDSLSTRARIIKMLPLSYSEITKRDNFAFTPNIHILFKRKTKPITQLAIFENIINGSMPDIINGSTKNITRFYETYCETTLFKDLREDMIKVQSHTKFLKFLKVLASYTSQEINYSNIARVVDIDDKRIKAWIEALEGMNVIFLLHPYSHNSLKRTVKSPKLFFYDTGIVCHLMNYVDKEVLLNSEFSGHIFECYAISEIVKGYVNSGKGVSMYYLQDSNKREVDLIIEGQGGILYPVEIKKTVSVAPKAFNNFALLKGLANKIGPLTVISCSKSLSVYEKDKKIILPVYWL